MHIVDPQEHVFVHAITSECVVLTCVVDREDALVHWYKDGQEVEESDFIVLENEGPHHRLVLPAAQPLDGGEFQCVAGEERACFTVTITGWGLLELLSHAQSWVTLQPSQPPLSLLLVVSPCSETVLS